ncbi:MAG: DNA-binding protein WhiA [Lachnospirales bacterium]
MSFTSKLKDELLDCEKDKKLKDEKYALGYLAGLLLTLCEYREGKFIIPIDKTTFYIKIVYIYELHFSEMKKNYISINSLKEKLFDVKNNSLDCDDSYLFSFKISKYILSSERAKRGLLTGFFLGAGYITNPEVDYHFELDTRNFLTSIEMQHILEDFNLTPKVVRRKKGYMIYIKEAEKISDLLKIFEASKSFFIFEDVRLIKDVRNNINRKVNCEVANLTKVINASTKQIQDIEFLLKKELLLELGYEIHYTASLRLKYPEISLKELGEIHNPPIGKSKVNYRLKRIGNYADSLRGETSW